MDYGIENTTHDKAYFQSLDNDMSRKMRIQDVCVEIIDGHHEYSVEDVVREVIYEDDALLARYKQGLQDIALGSTCGYELHMVIDDASEIMAGRIVDKELSK